MAISLAQAKLATQDKITKGVIDEFRKSSFLLDNMVFDDTVAPGGGGSTLTYGYTRVTTQPRGAFRAINAEYKAQEAQVTRYTVDLKPFGGSFQVDRVFANVGSLYSNIEFQIQQKVKAAQAVFNDAFINGDSGVNAEEFDGLDKAITGTSTEFNTDALIDLSTAAKLDSNYKQFMDMLDEFLAEFDGKPTVLMGNSKLITKIKAVARRAGYLTASEDAFGRKVDSYDGIALIDLGAKAGSTNPVCGIATRNLNGDKTGLTDLYGARLALDGVHGASLAGQPLVNVYLPDMSTPGAVKTGEVELVCAPVLKASKAAGVFRNIKVQ